MAEAQAGAFSSLLVVEVAGSVAGGYAGKLFACFGATVLLIEPPGGAEARRIGEPLPGGATLHFYLNTSKQSVCLDLRTASGRGVLGELLERTDLVIETSSPEPLDPVSRGARNERLVHLYISPFGLTGPYSRLRSTPLTDYAAGGHLFLNGEPDREPIQGAGRQSEYAAGTYGFIAAMAALRARARTGRGQEIDLSHMETMASLHQWTTVKYTHTGTIERRIGNRYSSSHPITIYPSKDGHVAISASGDESAARLLAVMGYEHLLADPRYANGVARLRNADAFDAEILPWLLEHTTDEIVELGQAVRVPVGPVPDLLELLANPHLNERGFWEALPAGGGSLRFPGPPFRLSRHPWHAAAAPVAGGGTRAALRLAGVDHGEALRQAGISAEVVVEREAVGG